MKVVQVLRDESHRVVDASLEGKIPTYEECSESNINHVDVAKKPFRLAGMKAGTRRRPKETVYEYRSRRMFSDLVSQALRYLNQTSGNISDEVLQLTLMFHHKELCEAVGRRVPSYSHQMYECMKAGKEARKMWDPEKYIRIQENASRAGSVKKYDLDDYLETASMTPTEALAYLREKKGIKSRTTIYEMRKHFSGIDLTTGEIEEMSVYFPEDTSHQDWIPATRKQMVYITALENQLGEPGTIMGTLTVRTASARIEYLKNLRELKKSIDAVFLEPLEGAEHAE